SQIVNLPPPGRPAARLPRRRFLSTLIGAAAGGAILAATDSGPRAGLAWTGEMASASALLTGRVSSRATGLAVGGAVVRLTPGGASATTDQTGLFMLFTAAGRYTVEVDASGFGRMVYPGVDLNE